MKRENELDWSDVRTAALHLMELAATYEGRGLDVSEWPLTDAQLAGSEGTRTVSKAESFPEDTKCLQGVVKLLLTHRHKQRKRQRNALLQRLVELTGRACDQFGAGEATREQFMESLRAILLGLWIDPSEAAGLLVVDERKGKSRGGVTFVVKALERLDIGLSERGIYDAKGDSNPLHDARQTFGRWLTAEERKRYHRDVERTWELLASCPAAELRDLGEFDESTGRSQDLRMEWIVAQGSDPAWAAHMLPEEPATRLRERAQAEVAERVAFVARLLDSDDEVPGEVGDDVPQAVESYRSCRSNPDADSDAAKQLALSITELAANEDQRVELRHAVVRWTGDLLPPPKWFVSELREMLGDGDDADVVPEDAS